MGYDSATPASEPTNSDAGVIDEKFQRLFKAVEFSHREMQSFRDKRMEAIREMVGRHYADKELTPKEPIPYNLIELEITTVVRQLSARAPRVKITSDHKQLKPTASLFTLALNKLLKEININETQRLTALNGFTGMGLVKIGLEEKQSVDNIDGETHDYGQPFVDVVDIDDIVFDMTSKKFGQCSFIGDRYRLPLDFIQSSELYDPECTKELKAYTGAGFDGDTADRIEDLSKTKANQLNPDAVFDPMVELWDVYVPRENKVYTLCPEYKKKPLREWDWNGPECGPYLPLIFQEIPNNILPLAPVAKSMDFHELVNVMMRKLGQQAANQKDVTLVKEGAESDGERVAAADNSDVITVQDPNNVREVSYAGMSPEGLAGVIQFTQMHNRVAGNLDATGGLGAQADTVGQEKLIKASSSIKINDMQDRMMEFMHKVVYSLAWYLWHDPLINMPLTKRIEGTDIEIPVTFTPEDRDGDFLDYNVNIEIYSIQELTPAMKLQGLVETYNTIIVPSMQSMAAAGIGWDFATFLKTLSELSGITELMDCVTFAIPPAENQPVGNVPEKMGGPPKPNNTTRTYVRENRSTVTPAGQANALSSALLGVKKQPAEMNRIGV